MTEFMRPFPDQQVAIDKFRRVASALIGDSMGVGKTVTAIGRDLQLREDNPNMSNLPTLIIPEKIGIDVWDWHLRAMGIPDKEILCIRPAKRQDMEDHLERLAGMQKRKGPNTKLPTDYRYFVCHWDSLPRMEVLTGKAGQKGKIKWGHVIGDEIHLIKTRSTVRTKALKRIETLFKTGCSGTLADDKPTDLWSILNWAYPKQFRSYWKFYDRYVIWEPVEPYGYRKMVGVKNIDELHLIMDPFYIRRTLIDVAPNMPEKIYVRPMIQVDMEAKQRREYDQMKRQMMAEIGEMGNFTLTAPAIIAKIIRLQQMALATLSPEWDIPDEDWTEDENDVVDWDFPTLVLSKPSPKLDALMNIIQTQENESFIVFTQFRGFADLVEEECKANHIPVVKITGAVLSKDVRTSLVEQFQSGKARVIVGTIAAMGKTVTLTKANHVIFTDRSWNPNKNLQAEDRAWRRTQKNMVRVIDIQARDSVDQLRAEVIESKGQLVDLINNPGTGDTLRADNISKAGQW